MVADGAEGEEVEEGEEGAEGEEGEEVGWSRTKTQCKMPRIPTQSFIEDEKGKEVGL